MSEITSHVEARREILSYLRNDFVGPKDGPWEVLKESPVSYYMAGILYPQGSEVDSAENQQFVEDEQNARADDDGREVKEMDDPVSLANEFFPSSLGISFFIKGAEPGITVDVSYGRYEQRKHDGKTVYDRVPFTNEHAPLQSTPEKTGYQKVEVERERSEVRIRWRSRGEGLWLVTVCLLNVKEQKKEQNYPHAQDCLFQCSITVKPATGNCGISEYTEYGWFSPDREKHILDMLYRRHRPYGVGHGCAVTWLRNGNRVEQIASSAIPESEVPSTSFETRFLVDEEQCQQAMSLLCLSRLETECESTIGNLRSFVGNYKKWIGKLRESNSDIPPGTTEELANEQITLCQRALKRMQRGIQLLETDETVRRAFALANRAMLMQLIHGNAVKGKPTGQNHLNHAALIKEYSCDRFMWRPFQLGFFLLSLASIVDNEDDHDVVDLIWYPTGGGKTEAYLGLAAFTILFLRLKYKDRAAGTNVFMRYTLRALTAQQFQRAATLVCALEHIRRESGRELGEKPVSLGLFVGEKETPNEISKAIERHQELLQNPDVQNPYQMQNCPWCGSPILYKTGKGKVVSGVRAGNGIFEFFCPNSSCEFHNVLPVNIVDQVLYNTPPDFLIGTVDKFARITWDPRILKLFGADGDFLPPSLILQDELHLIAGPLGSMMGLYETAIEELCTVNGKKPKIVASTATVRNAHQQCQNLFNRKVEVFPPTGLNADDSFFTRVDRTVPGRLYAGVLSPGKSSITALVRVCAALLQSVKEVPLSPQVLNDFYTLVAYYNALKELGKSNTLSRDDIPDRLGVIASDKSKTREVGNVVELSSNSELPIPRVIKEMERPVWESNAVDLLLTTNMISVGIDIDRLGLMMVNGQPKTVSEYIQATSRVGRKNPGLVVTLYSPTRIRDRSHYERFTAFHAAMYKDVEPSSVTPFSKQARDRALHVLLVILARRSAALRENDCAGNVAALQHEVGRIREVVSSRIAAVAPDELQAAMKQFDCYVETWLDRAKAHKDVLRYQNGKSNQFVPMLCHFDEGGSGWKTPNSMRNVEPSIEISE